METFTAWLRDSLRLAPGEAPFPWQVALLRRLLEGDVPEALDLPTGLGKTAVMAIWLVAQAARAPLPRRLVYIVDRRAVVDQATDIAFGLRAWVNDAPAVRSGLGLDGRALPISTLRGQFIDNREWLEDPAAPAIIVGTVDMIGSRLLFEGYGTSRKMRPYHAALLGCDSLLVLDEAHLVPPFEEMIGMVTGSEAFRPLRQEDRALLPPSKVLSLSATGRSFTRTTFGLSSADLLDETVLRRLHAKKRLRMVALGEGKLHEKLAIQAWALSQQGASPIRCVIFAHKRVDAEATKKEIVRLARGAAEPHIELLVGGRRAFEREASAKRLRDLGFLAGSQGKLDRPAFLLATSAGEVGVDLDADHMVADLVAWERMVQRLGRVNRRGTGDADVVVVVSPDPAPTRKVAQALQNPLEARKRTEHAAIEEYEASVRHARAQRQALESLPAGDGGGHDASPGALRDLRMRVTTDQGLRALLEAATTPAPLRPEVTRPLVDSWSMTSLREHAGRPEVAPWLRGWLEEDPRTTVVWRTFLPVRGERGRGAAAIEQYFEAAPPHASERLETETFRVVEWLAKRVTDLLSERRRKTLSGSASSGEPLGPEEVAAIALTSSGELEDTFHLEELQPADKKAEGRLARKLTGRTIIVDARIAGLTDGLLDPGADARPRTLDDGEPWLDGEEPNDPGPPTVRFRVRLLDGDEPPTAGRQWRERLRIPWELRQDGEVGRWLAVEKWRHDAASEDDRSAGNLQLLRDHQESAERWARAIARRVGVPADYQEMLALAARVHDEGKRSARWQRAFKAPKDAVYAKTPGPVNTALLDGYRHEFGSLPVAERNEDIRSLHPDLQELALHLIAAHHGFGRPVIGTDGCEDAPPSALQERARAVAFRFARLQRVWGPWGLAWWEALLRSADQQSSRENDAPDETHEMGEARDG